MLMTATPWFSLSGKSVDLVPALRTLVQTS
jgi:hypothetical protein